MADASHDLERRSSVLRRRPMSLLIFRPFGRSHISRDARHGRRSDAAPEPASAANMRDPRAADAGGYPLRPSDLYLDEV